MTYASAGGLRAVLESAPPVGAGRQIVVDHGADGSDDIAAELCATVLRDQTNPGFGAGQNRGLGAGAAEYVLLLNPDCRMRPGAVAAGLEFMSTHRSVAAVQGAIENLATGQPERSQGRSVGPVHLWGRALGLRRLLSVRSVRHLARRLPLVADHVNRVPTEPTEVASLAATALLIRRSAVEQIGGFDERYFLYGEDLDLCHRLRVAGWGIVALEIPWGEHIGGASSGSAYEREVVWWEGTMRYAGRWWAIPALASGVVAATLRALTLSRGSPQRLRELIPRLVVDPIRVARKRTEGGG